MNGAGKSDSAIVAGKPTSKDQLPTPSSQPGSQRAINRALSA
jgi:hypothetical protein